MNRQNHRFITSISTKINLIKEIYKIMRNQYTFKTKPKYEKMKPEVDLSKIKFCVS